MDQHPVQGGVAILLGMLHAKDTRINSGQIGPMAPVRLYPPCLIVHQTIIIILFCCLNNKQIKQELTSHTYRESLYFFASSAGIFLPINGPKKSCLGITHLANTPRPALGILDSLTSSPGGTITSAWATIESNQRIKRKEC